MAYITNQLRRAQSISIEKSNTDMKIGRHLTIVCYDCKIFVFFDYRYEDLKNAFRLDKFDN